MNTYLLWIVIGDGVSEERCDSIYAASHPTKSSDDLRADWAQAQASARAAATDGYATEDVLQRLRESHGWTVTEPDVEIVEVTDY